MTDVVVALESRRLCPDDRLFGIFEFFCDFLNVVTNDFTRATGKNHEQVGIDDFESVADGWTQLVCTAKHDFFFADTCARVNVGAESAARAVVIV